MFPAGLPAPSSQKSVPSLDDTRTEVILVEDATCTHCGCVCDDITLKVQGDRITEAKNACVLGNAWFSSHRLNDLPACQIEGLPASVPEGIERAARILMEARYPMIYGLSDTTSEAQRVAVSIGDWIGGCVDTTTSVSHGASVIAFQEVGEVTGTLGEIKNRGDLVIFWGSNPAESQPRHFTKYSLTAHGTYIPRGREDRYCVVVDVRKTESATEADLFIQVKPGKDFEILWALRALCKGIELDPDAVLSDTGVPLDTLRGLMDRMNHAKYGVIFSGEGLTSAHDGHLNSHALLSLVRDMNARTRFVCKPMRIPGNVTGADNVVTWLTGYPFAVSLGRGYPRFNPGEYTAADMLGRGEADAAFIIASDPMSTFSRAACEHLARIPSIVIDPKDTPTTRAATVVFHTATYGINTAGTVYRMDDVPIPLRPAFESNLPSDEALLKRVERRVLELRAEQANRI
jgi:formylmethanofuran dehydrogenase subunit B